MANITNPLPLDSFFELVDEEFALSPDELAFFGTLMKLDDEEQLRAHIVSVQKRACQIYDYVCIRKYGFVKLTITHQPGFHQARSLLKSQNGAVFLDIGCCFGTDVRKVVLDGWPVQDVVASDLRKEFWDYGHELFLSTPDSFPVTFIPGDIFDASTLQPRQPFINDQEVDSILNEPIPLLPTLKDLSPLQGKISAIHASSLFHLFSQEDQLTLARRLASLLRPEKGSVIFGQHSGLKIMGFRPPLTGLVTPRGPMFCHSPESWADLWINHVFGGNDERGSERIRVHAEFIDPDWVEGVRREVNSGDKIYMQWSVTRL